MLASPLTEETSRTVLVLADEPGASARIHETLVGLEADARGAMLAEGADSSTLTTERRIDARYVGQSFEIGVPASDWVEMFHQSHLERYGYERRQTPVEAVTLRVSVSAPAPPLVQHELASAQAPPATRPLDVVFGGKTHEAVLLLREDLRAGHVLSGPAVIQEYSGTTWVPLGCQLEVDAWGCLHLVFES